MNGADWAIAIRFQDWHDKIAPAAGTPGDLRQMVKSKSSRISVPLCIALGGIVIWRLLESFLPQVSDPVRYGLIVVTAAVAAMLLAYGIWRLVRTW